MPTSLRGVGSMCCEVLTLVGIHSISLAARCRSAACSNTFKQGFEEIQAARAFYFTPIFALSSAWEKKFLAASMFRGTLELFNIVRREAVGHHNLVP